MALHAMTGRRRFLALVGSLGVGAIADAIRRVAYGRPTHDPLHWLLLLVADRLDWTDPEDLVVPVLALSVFVGFLFARRR